MSDYREDKKALNEINMIQKDAILEEAEKNIEKIPELEKVKPPLGIELIDKANGFNANKDEELNSENSNGDNNKAELKIEEEKEDNNNISKNGVENIYESSDLDDDESIV